MNIIERDWDWWAYFWRVLHRQTIPHIEEWDKRVAKFVIEVVGCKRGEKLLDLGSGSGEHTRLLAEKGVVCTGVEIAPSLVRYARRRAKQERLKVNYINRDMRKIDFREEFDYCMMVSGTFGFFSDAGNANILKKMQRALRPGGRLLLDIRNAKYPRKDGKTWMELKEGYLLTESTYDDKTHRESGTYIFIDQKGNVNVQTARLKRESNRLYPLSEVKKMLRHAELNFLNAFCGFRLPPTIYRHSYRHNIVIIAEKTSS